MWQSVAPWISTGYGQQTALTTVRLRDAGHDVAISAIAGLEGTIGEWEGMKVYPADNTRFNKLNLRKYVQRHSADGTGNDVQVITLQDVWTWLDASSQTGGVPADYRGLKLASWCPVEYDPMPINTAQVLQAFASRPIAMSRFGEDRMRQRGFDPLYVPHAVDTSLLRPQPAAAAQVRQALGVTADAFVIGMVSNNQGIAPARKAFPEVFHAFSVFQQNHPDAILYLHTDALGLNHGLNLTALWQTYGIPESAIRTVNQDKYWFGEIATEHMGYMYSALDVLACPSYGEGFGIPIVEAQACGTPVIVTDWTSMSELVGPGWMVDGEPHYAAGSASMWKKPAVSELIDRFELAYAARGDEKLSEECRRFALRYDVDTVFEEHWVPALEKLSKPREVPPLPALNRKTRRAKIKAKSRTSSSGALV
jgi:glycosyltransferase involved in cell wall biosynthesis